SEEHTSELQSLTNLVCRLLLEKKKNWDEGVSALLNAARLLRSTAVEGGGPPSKHRRETVAAGCSASNGALRPRVSQLPPPAHRCPRRPLPPYPRPPRVPAPLFGALSHSHPPPPTTRVGVSPHDGAPLVSRRLSPRSYCLFFFKFPAAPRLPPFSPTRPSPV